MRLRNLNGEGGVEVIEDKDPFSKVCYVDFSGVPSG